MLTIQKNTRRLLQKTILLAHHHHRPRSCRDRLLSTKNVQQQQQKEVRDGAWTVLKALEKAKEAQTVQVAQLVSSFEALLPRVGYEDDSPVSSFCEQHTSSQEHTSDPAFFSLSDIEAAAAAATTLVVDNQKKEKKEPPILQSPPPLSPSRPPVGVVVNVSGEDVRKLLQATRQGRRVSLKTTKALIKAATIHFQSKSRVVRLPPLQQLSSTSKKNYNNKPQQQQLTVIGDLHGSLSDLEAILGMTGEPSRDNILVFNGDLADRGDHGVEIIVIVCALALAYPDCVHVNRGNHEDLALSIAYGLAAEVQHKYGTAVFRNKLGPILDAFFCSLPLATVIQEDALIVHGGPPPPGIQLSEFSNMVLEDNQHGISRTIRVKGDTYMNKEHEKAQEIIETMLWSDPIVDLDENELADYQNNRTQNGLGWTKNTFRGAGHKYDASVVRSVLEAEGLYRFIRSHEAVKKGCDRYVIKHKKKNQQGTVQNAFLNKRRNMEFFTVFSASRYPHKEGFNQGAILTLKPNGNHRVIRYTTEEDEPRRTSVLTTLDEGSATSTTTSPIMMDSVDSSAILRVLQQVSATHRPELFQSLERLAEQQNSKNLPFDVVVDILIRILRLEDEAGLKKPAALMAFAKALSVPCSNNTVAESIDLDQCIRILKRNNNDNDDDDDVGDITPFYPWLHDVFEMVDLDHNGMISRAEWLQAVTTINAKLPKGSKKIHAEATWELLDLDGDGFVTSSEWIHLGKGLCR